MQKKRDIKLKLLLIKILSIFVLSNLIPVKSNSISEQNKSTLDTSYLESRRELKDYILDTGDIIFINFSKIPELSGSFSIDPQGEIYLERLKETYVRGLTIDELTKLLEESYQKFLINPEIKITLQTFKPVRVAITGEIRNPGILKFYDPINSFST